VAAAAPRWLRGNQSGACAAASRPASDWASIPLLSGLRGLARGARALELRPVFGPAGMPFEHRLAARLARSARRWLVHHGLPAVFADLLAGGFRFATLATSAYLNIAEGQIAHAHAAAAARWHATVLTECRQRGWNAGYLVDPALFEPPTDDGRRFGSRIVPRPEVVARAVAGLAERRRPVRVERPLAELTRAWNLEVVARWIRLQWAGALRPCRDPIVRRGRYDPRSDWLLVDDKDSPFSRETRLVPLPRGECAHLARLQEPGDRVRHRLRATTRVTADALPADALFFLIAEHQVRPLTPADVRTVLEREGLASAFPWPFNAPRHFWLARALESGVILDRIEPFLGHAHEPGVPWGPFTLSPLEYLATPVRQFGARILAEVGYGAP
jgi:hypothetical protein